MADEKEKIVLTGQVLIKLGVMNLNNRIYVDNENLKEIIDEYNKHTKTHGGFGELGYPEKFEIMFSNISHKVENLRIEGDALVGDVTLLGVSKSKIIKENLDLFVFRPRLTGRVLENGEVVIDKIFAFDAINKEEDAFKEDENLESLLMC